jgi:hypothetical protein
MDFGADGSLRPTLGKQRIPPAATPATATPSRPSVGLLFSVPSAIRGRAIGACVIWRCMHHSCGPPARCLAMQSLLLSLNGALIRHRLYSFTVVT